MDLGTPPVAAPDLLPPSPLGGCVVVCSLRPSAHAKDPAAADRHRDWGLVSYDTTTSASAAKTPGSLADDNNSALEDGRQNALTVSMTTYFPQ